MNIFPKIDKLKWKISAKNYLNGINKEDELSWENESGILLDVYYDISDLENLTYLEDFFTNIQRHRWKLYERVYVQSERDANKSALEALRGGCDGIIFDLMESRYTSQLLKDIDEEICDLSFVNRSNKSLPTNSYVFTESNCVFENSIHSSPISQLTELILSLRTEVCIHRTAFTDFFLEIASIRALRFLLGSRTSGIHIHTQVPKHESKDSQWFMNTTVGLASVLGGSNSIDLATSSGDPRISRNIGNLIREESGIKEYSDQCGGSYYIEVLTDRIIKGVQQKMR